MLKKDRYFKVLSWFQENKPEAETELHYSSTFQLLVAVVLSAQCTDRRVNMVTPRLFERFPSPADFASASFEEVFPYVSSISYPNSKTSHLIALSQRITNEFNNEVPSDYDDLLSLPGVGRKTANVISSIVYNKPVIAVDTHVFRVSRRIGLSDGKTVEAVEKELEKNIPENQRAIAHHWLILHGRYTCTARSPKCAECPIADWCRDFSLRKVVTKE